ncbi:ankyrin repeat domain-containing protein 9 [Gouania willdenowi]|uniref:Ankyrin repeat domain 9 n=1 Tax=Gouania willdenowi TaxID=441366 RepID=A0A8C5HQW7_GOUWI|nr:ankyrin repeat domain-containing protein 9 [Gouania willdenowi]
MPWRLSSQLERASCAPCQRECERTAFSFYCAVREKLPPWLLEETRRLEVFSWDDGVPRAFLPSEALLYALVHDHQDYAVFLLDRFALDALKAPRCSFCCCAGTPHLSVAVRYDRLEILGMMVRTLKAGGGRSEYLDGCGGCSHVADAGKTAVQLAAELLRPDCLLLLLLHGARPQGLEGALQRLLSCTPSERRLAQRCVDTLLLFLKEPTAPPHAVTEQPARLRLLLGQQVFTWLSGHAPPPLLHQALRCLVRIGPDRISALPHFLQP